VSAAQPPVFVDDTGRRRILTRRAGRVVVLGFTGYLGLVALGFARDPRVGPISLPTFGLSSLGLMVPPAPTALGEEATRTASEAGGEAPSRHPAATPAVGGTATPGTDTPIGASSPASTPARSTAPGKATTSPTTGAPASSTSSTSTTTASTSTTSSTTSSTTRTLPGHAQGQGQGSGSATAKGPDGSGAPGQLRKTTSTTAG
jgi:hypothetical protein